MKVPFDVRASAERALTWKQKGYEGGTSAGWNRAKQLASNDTVSVHTLAKMRHWFSRHGPDAKNGGTSYQGFVKFLKTGEVNRGAVSWELWGGDGAYLWLKNANIRKVLHKAFPRRKNASLTLNLTQCNEARCKMFTPSQQYIGTVQFVADKERSVVRCNLQQASPGKHGLHIHECVPSDIGDCASTCAHYNPEKKQHGDATGGDRHRGDLGNCVFNYFSLCKSVIVADIMLREVLGRSVILHADADDLGKGHGNFRRGSLKTGNAGKRIACGVVLLV